MPDDVHETAPTQFVQSRAADIRRQVIAEQPKRHAFGFCTLRFTNEEVEGCRDSMAR